MTNPVSNAARAPTPSIAPTPYWFAWLLGGIFIVPLMLFDYLTFENGIVADSVLWGRDFINVWTGGALVDLGRTDIIYDLDAYVEFQRGVFGQNLNPHNYSYPPVTFPFATLFSRLPYEIALACWLIGTGALFVWAARSWWPQNAGPHWLAIATPAGLINIWAGHYGFLVGALFLLGWQRLDRQPVLAGIFFGLMIIKPHLAVLVPLALLLRRDWLALASGAMTVALLVGVTGVAYGWRLWGEYLLGTSAVQADMIDNPSILFTRISTSLMTGLLAIDVSWPVALAAQAASATFAVALVVLAVRRRVGTRPLALLVATGTFLVLPYAFNYDMTVVMVAALAIMARPDVASDERRLATYGFMSAQLGMVLALYGLPIMSLMIAGLAWVQLRVASRDASGQAPAPVAASNRDMAGWTPSLRP